MASLDSIGFHSESTCRAREAVSSTGSCSGHSVAGSLFPSGTQDVWFEVLFLFLNWT